MSLNSGEQVYQALDQTRYDIRRYDPKDDLVRLAQDASGIDVALIILHGRLGEDGTIQGLLERLNIPYQGSGVLGSAIAMNGPEQATLPAGWASGAPVPGYVPGRAAESRGVAARTGVPGRRQTGA